MKLHFAGFVLDQEAGVLTGPEGEIRLRPQAFRMLEVLADQAPKILSQEELLDRVWGVEHLSPASVKQAVSEVRQALGDDPARPVIIETVHRRGYRFISLIERIEEIPSHVKNPELATRPIAIPSLPAVATVAAPAHRRLSLRFAAIPILAGLSALALMQRPLPEAQDPPVAQAATKTVSARSAIAVLGFKNLSGEPADDWISSALTEIVGFELAAPGRLRLIPADSVARMKRELALPYAESHSPDRLAGIGRNLGTDLVVTGSYLLAEGEKLRVQILVQNVHTGETVAWARETGDPEELIDLATAAARGVQGTLSGGKTGPESAFAANAESLRLYSEALARLRLGDAPAALPLLDRAVALDGNNPFIHDALAATYAYLGFKARPRRPRNAP